MTTTHVCVIAADHHHRQQHPSDGSRLDDYCAARNGKRVDVRFGSMLFKKSPAMRALVSDLVFTGFVGRFCFLRFRIVGDPPRSAEAT